MNIENIWQQESAEDDELNKLISNNNFSNLQSRLPLKKLRANLLLGIVWAMIINILYIIIALNISIWLVHLAFAVMIISNFFIMIDSWRLYQKTPAFIAPSNSVKDELKLHYNSFQRWWSLQQKMSLFIYPVAVSGGFILGGYLGSGKPVEEFLYNGRMLVILGITILVMVPICYYSARWMFNYAYGKHLKQLKSTIDELG